MRELEDKNTTYFFKKKFQCPVCGVKLEREAAMTGGGRLIAGDLTDELRRLYEPSEKYGAVFPVIYPVSICPECGFALLHEDFDSIPREKAAALRGSLNAVWKKTQTIFPYFSTKGRRSVFDGAAAYYEALQCYALLPAEFSPTIKMAVTSLRLAWLCGELDAAMPGRNYDFISARFYSKAEFLYDRVLELEESGSEPLPKAMNFGPDIDKNYGFDGIQYLSALLTFKYFPKDDAVLRTRKINAKKTAMARIFGLGKSSKEKPGPLLEKTRELYEKMQDELKSAYSVDKSLFGDLDLE